MSSRKGFGSRNSELLRKHRVRNAHAKSQGQEKGSRALYAGICATDAARHARICSPVPCQAPQTVTFNHILIQIRCSLDYPAHNYEVLQGTMSGSNLQSKSHFSFGYQEDALDTAIRAHASIPACACSGPHLLPLPGAPARRMRELST